LAISRKTKERLLAEYIDKFSSSEVTIWTDYQGLNVAEISDLRNRLREAGAKYHVTKNRLVRRALVHLDYPVPEEYLAGPTAICFCGENIASAARLLVDAERAHRSLAIKGGLTKTGILAREDIRQLASLPSREVLIAQVVGGIQSPLRGLVTVLSAPLRGFVTVLKARADQLEKAA